MKKKKGKREKYYPNTEEEEFGHFANFHLEPQNKQEEKPKSET